MNALLARLLSPALAIALAGALLLAGHQWGRALIAEKALTSSQAEFASYREQVQANHAAALRKAAEEKSRSDKARQEALDAEYLARQAAEADRDRLRAGNGQLQRYAADLATSLADRARDTAAPGSCQAASEQLAFVVGALDDFAAAAGSAADDARRAGQLCERTYDALTK
ncbi:DUF2514 family protein [Roseateles sp. SL47]|uniref:DUF2514 family protein n=1 Tax=Roseateles sp. SL47 TaxID=2995138 RepID=UPI002271171B|nr:DUF2514 family protein [Roseateles sp. SL47]WAC72059.1 DUF2514 family protein [Roseateles sp. SL47]